MIFTIGYQRLAPAQLTRVVAQISAALIDVRSKPVSRKPGFSRGALEKAFGARYTVRGDVFGGVSASGQGEPKAPDAAALAALAKQYGATQGPNALLLCMEEAPGDCHRHRLLAGPLMKLGARIVHLYRDEAIEAGELARAIADEDDYACEACAEHGIGAGGAAP